MSNRAETGRAPGTVQSLDRAITILELLAQHGEAGVTEVAAELEVHKSTAFRLLGTLEARGLVEQSDDRGKYRIGIGLVRLAGATSARLDVVQQSRPVCQELAAETGETVNVAVLVEGAAHYVFQVAGSAALQPQNWVGRRIPLHATSSGKVLLAGQQEELLASLVPTLPAHTARTITRRTTLRRELAAIRRDGYAVAVDELEEGLTAIAAPIRDAYGDVVASLSVSGSSFRLDEAALTDVVPQACAAAEEISFQLGWTGRSGEDETPDERPA